MVTQRVCLSKFDETLSTLSDAFRTFELVLPPPVLVGTAHGWFPRYRPPLLEHALLMKLARLISVTSAIRALVESGHTQEQGILQRVADETGDDIMFLALGQQNGLRAVHRRYLNFFWREEFDGPADPKAYTPRYMVKRREIRDYIAEQLPAPAAIPEELGRMVYGVYSGFVHGASTHIFDLVDRKTGCYRVTGIAEESDRSGYLRDALNYPLRSLMAAAVVAKVLGQQDAGAKLMSQTHQYQAWLDTQDK